MNLNIAAVLSIAVLMAIVFVLPTAADEDGAYRASIGNVKTLNMDGNVVASATVGSPVVLQSQIVLNNAQGYSDGQQEYTYYVQIKVSEKDPHVEYVGVYEGILDTSGTEIAWILWTPESAGLYYVETYVWDGMMPLTNPGPVSLILVN